MQVSNESVENKIIMIRDEKVILDGDIAFLYGVETKRLIEQMKRNIERFPKDFMFQLSDEEYKILRSQNATSSWGGRRTNPYAFTEQGLYMIATVLKSPKAIETNIAIIRTFTKMRQAASRYRELLVKVEKLEKGSDRKFDLVAMELQKIYTILESLEEGVVADTKKMGFIH